MIILYGYIEIPKIMTSPKQSLTLKSYKYQDAIITDYNSKERI